MRFGLLQDVGVALARELIPVSTVPECSLKVRWPPVSVTTTVTLHSRIFSRTLRVAPMIALGLFFSLLLFLSFLVSYIFEFPGGEKLIFRAVAIILKKLVGHKLAQPRVLRSLAWGPRLYTTECEVVGPLGLSDCSTTTHLSVSHPSPNIKVCTPSLVCAEEAVGICDGGASGQRISSLREVLNFKFRPGRP